MHDAPFTATVGVELYPLPPEIRMTEIILPLTSEVKLAIACEPPNCGLLNDNAPLEGHPVPLNSMLVIEPVKLTPLMYEVSVTDFPLYMPATGAPLPNNLFLKKVLGSP